jgi:hypothetical protein
MSFYQQENKFYRGVDLHARTMCEVDKAGQAEVDKNIDARPDRFLPLIRPYREGLIVAARSVSPYHRQPSCSTKPKHPWPPTMGSRSGAAWTIPPTRSRISS